MNVVIHVYSNVAIVIYLNDRFMSLHYDWCNCMELLLTSIGVLNSRYTKPSRHMFTSMIFPRTYLNNRPYVHDEPNAKLDHVSLVIVRLFQLDVCKSKLICYCVPKDLPPIHHGQSQASSPTIRPKRSIYVMVLNPLSGFLLQLKYFGRNLRIKAAEY